MALHSRTHNLAVVFALFLMITLPASVGFRHAELNYDESRCYFPAIDQLRASFPVVNIAEDSLSANPPGYTHLLAGVSLFAGESIPLVRLCHAVLCAAGAVFLASLFMATFGPQGFSYALPLVFSTYFLKQACVISTDDVAIIGSGSAFVLLLWAPLCLSVVLIAGVLTLLATYCRHISAWVAAPFSTLAILLALRGISWQGPVVSGALAA